MSDTAELLINVEDLHKIFTAEKVERHALAGNPSILSADEPMGNLDPNSGEATMGLLAELHREGATLCMVTHHPRYAYSADHTVNLFDGRIVGAKR